MVNKELFLEYKQRCKVDNNHFCLLNFFGDEEFCTSPFRQPRSNNKLSLSCCKSLCSYYKDMQYDMATFMDMAMLLRIDGKISKKVIKNIDRKLRDIIREYQQANGVEENFQLKRI